MMTSEKIRARFPFSPFPAGIFAVAFSKALAPKKVMPLVFMGKKIVLFRTTSGALSAV